MFKKVEVSILDICILYGCMGFLTYVVGGLAYHMGKDKGREEEQKKHNRRSNRHYEDLYEREPY